MNPRREVLAGCFDGDVLKTITKLSDDAFNSLEEVRIRTGRGVYFKGCNALCRVIPDTQTVKDIMMRISEFSLYAHIEQLRRGYITLKGGHRAGIVGRCVIDGGNVQNITEISSICIRIAKEIKGVADGIISHCINNNVLIISPPGCGKTTLLRDLASQLGAKHNIALIDERCEIAACVDGIPQLDVGQGTDVMSGLPKADAIPLVVRSMSPDIIMTDELSGDDIHMVSSASSMGVRVIATVHGSGLSDVKNRIDVTPFDKYIILDKNKRIAEVV